MKRLLLAALTTLSIGVYANSAEANSWERCVETYGDSAKTLCSQMSYATQYDPNLENYWFECVEAIGNLADCNEAIRFGTISTYLQYSWVQVMGSSNVRTGPGLDYEVLGVTNRVPWIMTAHRVVEVLDEPEYLWVQVEFTVGLHTYDGYVREDRIITSLLQ